MKQFYVMALVAVLLSACDSSQDNIAQDTVVASNEPTTQSDYHEDGERYLCDGKPIAISVEEHEGELEAHAVIDDTEYDMHPDTDQANTYIAHDEGIDNLPMTMTLSDDEAVFRRLGDGTVLLTCKKQR